MDLTLVVDVADKKNCKIKDKLLQMHFMRFLASTVKYKKKKIQIPRAQDVAHVLSPLAAVARSATLAYVGCRGSVLAGNDGHHHSNFISQYLIPAIMAASAIINLKSGVRCIELRVLSLI